MISLTFNHQKYWLVKFIGKDMAMPKFMFFLIVHTSFIKQSFLWVAWNSKTAFTGSKFEEVNIGSILLKWMNFDGHDDDRAGKQKQCSAENLPIFLASFVKVSIFLIILSRHHLHLSALHHGALRLYKVSFGFSYIYN